MAPAKGKGKGAADAGRGKKAALAVPQRIANAKDLRGQFASIQNSPDGADPQPLTVPKCVECGHCGWPVYPRDSRVATRKTFERAGIQRDYGDKKKEEEQKEAGGEAGAEGGDLDIGPEDDGDGAGSEDSVGTVEMLETKVQDLEERVLDLEGQNENLEKDAAEMRQQVEDLEEALAASEEKIELLEESEMRWREKNSVLRVENEDLRLYINRLGSRIGDLETDMVKKLEEIKWRKEAVARDARRRALMLTKLDQKMFQLEGGGLLAALFTVWRDDCGREKRRRQLQEAEERRRLQVSELAAQLSQEKQHILSLEATTQRLRSSLKAAAHRMLLKVMSTSQKPWATGHALSSWCAVHPALKFENERDALQKELSETQIKLADSEAQATQLAADLEETRTNLDVTTKERNELSSNYATMMQELQSVLGSQGKQAEDIQRMAEEKARAARELIVKETWEEANKEMEKMKQAFNVEKVGLEDTIGGLEAQLEAIKRGLSGSKGECSEETRVVPKGQGVLCVGCLKQIVNRGVKQLPPVRVEPPSPTQEEAKKKLFFQQELAGMPDADDILHSEVWKSRRDPMAGLRYADVSPEVSWAAPTKSSSMKQLTPLKIKENLKFKTVFR